MSALRAALEDYLRIRRRLGFAMPQDGRMLEGFVEFLDRAGAQRISTEMALAWARLPVDVHPFTSTSPRPKTADQTPWPSSDTRHGNADPGTAR